MISRTNIKLTDKMETLIISDLFLNLVNNYLNWLSLLFETWKTIHSFMKNLYLLNNSTVDNIDDINKN